MAEWDVLVVGGGTAGMTAARAARTTGARVALVERDRLGGECTYSGCVPSKALIEVSRIFWNARRGARWGIHADGLRLDFAELMAHKDSVVAEVARDEAEEGFTEAGITVLSAPARFTGAHTAVVGGDEHRFSSAVIASGSDPAVPDIPGLDTVPFLTNESVFSISALPERLVVLGGGPIGLELGQAFARLGSRVTVVHSGEQLLVREDPEVGRVVRGYLQDEGLELRLGATATGVTRTDEGIAVTVTTPDGIEVIRGDTLLVATGRRPRVAGLGLEALGVEPRPGGLEVDERMGAGAKAVYAAGDVTGRFLFTHVAAYEGRIAGLNACGEKEKADYRVVPWVTFLDPEVARVGLTEPEARAAHDDVEVARFPMNRVDRARMLGEPLGFIKIITAGRRVLGRTGGGEIVGAHIVGRDAGELLHEVVVAMQARVFAGRLAQAIHAYPTTSMGIQQATSQLFPIGRALVNAGELPLSEAVGTG